MRRTIPDYTPDGLKRRIADLERGLADERRKGYPAPEYVEPAAGGAKLPFFVAASDATDESKTLSDYVCTGTNDEVTIQAAVDAIAAYESSTGFPYILTRNAPLLFSEGIFYLSASVNLGPTNMMLRGAGMQRTLFQAAVSGVAAFTATEPISARDLSFFDFAYALYQPSSSQNDEGTTVHNCWFEDCTYPITMYAADLMAVSECWFYGASTAITLTNCDRSTISSNHFFSSSNTDISGAELGVTAIDGNMSTTSAHFVALGAYPRQLAITGNTVDAIQTAGIRIGGAGSNAVGSVVAGNQINAGTAAALLLDGPSISASDPPIAITGNNLIGTARVDIRAHVTGNYISGGIQFNAPCDKALCSNNWLGDTAVHGSAAPTFTDNTTGAIVSKGAGNYLDGVWTP